MIKKLIYSIILLIFSINVKAAEQYDYNENETCIIYLMQMSEDRLAKDKLILPENEQSLYINWFMNICMCVSREKDIKLCTLKNEVMVENYKKIFKDWKNYQNKVK